MNVSKTSVSLALTAILGSSGVAVASENPFGMQVLDQGYMVAEADSDSKPEVKAKDGKCGEGKCGAGKAETSKAKDGKCGEGKCGANKAKPAEGSAE